MKTVLSRRRLLAGGIGITVGAPLIAQDNVIERMMKATPPQQLGPFYPIARPLDQDADLTRIEGHADAALGERMDLFGVVRDFDGNPVGGATLDLWQANEAGRYAHGGDTREELPLDPHFQGSAKIRTDAEGRYRFRTIKPGIYGVGDIMRPRHIHFTIDGKQSRLTTQMYFPGEKENALEDIAEDSLLVAHNADPLEARIAAYHWDVVLPFG
jgi:protocatechuate 3,4-dioxygenase, beta subunit